MTVLSDVVTALRDTIDAVAPKHQQALNALLGGGSNETGDALTVAAALVNLFAAASVEVPLFLSFDDIHWLDPFSAHVIGLTVRRLQTEPVLVMLAGRTIPEMLSGHGSRIEVPGLSAPDCEQMLRDLALTRPSPEVIAALAEHTRGNPRMLAEGRTTAHADATGWNRTTPGPLAHRRDR